MFSCNYFSTVYPIYSAYSLYRLPLFGSFINRGRLSLICSCTPVFCISYSICSGCIGSEACFYTFFSKAFKRFVYIGRYPRRFIIYGCLQCISFVQSGSSSFYTSRSFGFRLGDCGCHCLPWAQLPGTTLSFRRNPSQISGTRCYRNWRIIYHVKQCRRTYRSLGRCSCRTLVCRQPKQRGGSDRMDQLASGRFYLSIPEKDMETQTQNESTLRRRHDQSWKRLWLQRP